MTARTVGQPKPAARARISTGSARSPFISRSTTSTGTAHSVASAAMVSSYLPLLAIFGDVGLGELALLVQRPHRAPARRCNCAARPWRRPRRSPSPARGGSRLAFRAWPAPAAACCTTSVACISNWRNRRGGMSVRRPTFSASTPSCSARLTRVVKASSDSRALRLVATLRATVAVAAPHQHVGQRFADCQARRTSPADAPGSWSRRCV